MAASSRGITFDSTSSVGRAITQSRKPQSFQAPVIMDVLSPSRTLSIQTLARRLQGAGQRPARIFIAASDTGAGKTWLSEALLREWRRRGIRSFGLKAVSCGGPADARRLARASASGWTLALADPVPLRRPVAPAAQSRPRWETIVRRIRRSLRVARAAGARVILVEGAGGLLCPVDGRRTMRELAAALGARLLVVAPNRLGVLNHALLVLEAARAARLPVIALALNGGIRGAARPALRRSNARLLRRLANVPVFEVC